MTTGESAGNLGKTALSGTYCQPGWSTYNIRCAIAFTTGNQSAGYTLESVTADFAAPNGSPSNIIVAIHEPESDGGGSSVGIGSTGNPKDAALVTLSGSTPTRLPPGSRNTPARAAIATWTPEQPTSWSSPPPTSASGTSGIT